MTIDSQILSALRAVGAGSVSGADLAQRLGISRAAVWARIQELREFGYDIAAGPHFGYRLVSAPDCLNSDDLISLRGESGIIGSVIQVFQETTSTNDIIDRMARDGVPEGVVVFAESQTRGRGRLGRVWMSPPRAGLWFSVLLRPDLRPQETTQLTVAAATAVARAIKSQTGVSPDVKWPNDILVRGKKVAGILTELTAELDHVKYVILGIGVDVNQQVSDFPSDLRRLATSLRIETGRAIDRSNLAAAILRELDNDYARISAGQFEAVADEWESLCVTLGHPVEISLGGRQVRGRAEALDVDGALLIRTQHGRLERIISGDVRVEQRAAQPE